MSESVYTQATERLSERRNKRYVANKQHDQLVKRSSYMFEM